MVASPFTTGIGNGSGGGLFNNAGTMSVVNTTVSGNTATNGGGLFTTSPRVTLTNTIVAGQDKGGNITVYNNSTDSGTNNLIGDGTGMVGISNGSQGNQVGTTASPIDPMLAPLGNYGGPTRTMPLFPGSPAIDAGTSTGAPPPTSAARLGSVASISAPSRARASSSHRWPAAHRRRQHSARRSPTRWR